MYELEKAWIEKALVSLGVDLSSIEFEDLSRALRVHIGSKSMAFDQWLLDGLVQSSEDACSQAKRRLKALIALPASAS
jgi:hypothetical protein